jgi:hypothetical protein
VQEVRARIPQASSGEAGCEAMTREAASSVRTKRKRFLTVREVIKLLEAMPDKEMTMMIDCPYCGKGNQLASIAECVVLRSAS